MAGPFERYQKLGLSESLSRSYQYPVACKELSFILRIAYSKLPKNLQSLVFHDTLTAFRLLPQVQTQAALSAANLLLQSSEAALPKQKKVLAVTEFKHAMVAHKRRTKARQEEEGLVQLPQDVLVHMFSFLDLRSLASAALVCRLWNTASRDNHLWQLQHVIFFGESDNCSIVKGHKSGGLIKYKEGKHLQDDVISTVSLDWRGKFKRAYKDNLSKKFTAHRGYCRHCNSLFWLSNMKCFNEHSGRNCKNHQIKPVSTQQIVEYILDDAESLISSSDSDSDSDGGSISKLWAYPARFYKDL